MNQEYPQFRINKNKYQKTPWNQSQEQMINKVQQQAEYFGDMIKSEEPQISQIWIDGLNFISSKEKNIKHLHFQNFAQDLTLAKMNAKDSFCAAGLMDGSLGIINIKNTLKSFVHPIWNKAPMTALEWSGNNQLYVGNTEGVLLRLEILDDPRKKVQLQESIQPDSEEQILTIDINKENNIVAFAGKKGQIILVDAQTNQVLRKYFKGSSFCHGHTNRVFKIKFDQKQKGIFFSGGWDQTVFQWDSRQLKPVNSFFGPCISGDSIDLKDSLILTGSYKERNALEIWDIRNLNKICEVSSKTRAGNSVNYISSCQFSWLGKENGDFIIAGSSMSSVVGIYSKDIVYSLDVEIQGIQGSVYTTGVSQGQEGLFYFGTNDGKIYIYSYHDGL